MKPIVRTRDGSSCNADTAAEAGRSNRQVFKGVLQAFLLALLPALTNTADAQKGPVLKTAQDLSVFCETYYKQPRPELVSRAVDVLYSTGILKDANAVPPIVGFFSEVFAANPDQLPKWQAQIKKQDEQTKAVLQGALSLSQTGGALKLEGHSPSFNDMYWGAFYATGNLDYLQKLVDQLRYFDERDDIYLFMTGATAKWFLASNVRSHILVRSTLETAKLNADERTKGLISELLAQDPAYIQQETSEILRKQKADGKWK